MADEEGVYHAEPDDALGFAPAITSAAKPAATDAELILEMFLDNLGQRINTGLIIAGQNNGQPQKVMNTVWNTYWTEAEQFMEHLMVQADTAAHEWATYQEEVARLYRPSVQQPVTKKQVPRRPSETRQPERVPDPVFGLPPGVQGKVLRPFEPQSLRREQLTAPDKPKTGSKFQMGREYYLGTTEGIREAEQAIWSFYRGKVSFDIGDLDLVAAPSGGSGRRGFTAQEIRDRFDIDALTRQATNIFRTTLLTDDVDTRSMAKAYVEAVVATKGEKEIDFIEFITLKAEATDRYASIYRSKPKSMTSAQYLAPYFQAAQVAGPEAAAGVAIEGAQFGSDPATFNARLRRTDAVTSSSAFINELHQKFSNLNKVFKG